jgi:hypothetical protein
MLRRNQQTRNARVGGDLDASRYADQQRDLQRRAEMTA